MTPLSLDPTLFDSIDPSTHPRAREILVEHELLPEVLNPGCVLLVAPNGYGKTTLAVSGIGSMVGWLHIYQTVEHLDSENTLGSLLDRITNAAWNYVRQHPAALHRLGRRAAGLKYFWQRYVGVDIDYLLECLADDYPEYKQTILEIADLQTKELFSATAEDHLRLHMLLDCVVRLGFQGVAVWIDLDAEWKDLSDISQKYLFYLFDSLYLVRNPNICFKCLVVPSVAERLNELRALQTLSVERFALRWQQAQIETLVNRRLHMASNGEVSKISHLIARDRWDAFLQEFSDIGNPVAWLALAKLAVTQVNRIGRAPVDNEGWLQMRRAYCAEHLKIRLDEYGNFWRGPQRLDGLTERKRAIYPLVRYLYENPGFQRTYKLMDKFGMDENTLNTNISRARKDHIEPIFADAPDNGETIYLVTDYKGGGYALFHTARSP